MKFKPLFFLLIIFVIFYSNSSLGKENHLDNFNMSIEKLPINYKGVNVSELYSMLSKKVPVIKNEFESTSEYEKKVSELVSNNILALKLNPLEFNFTGGLHIAPYNADQEKFQLSIRTVALSSSTHRDYRASLILQTFHKSSKNYIGSNAFGATRNVTDYEATQYGIALVNEKNFGVREHKTDYNFKSTLESQRILNSEIEISPIKARNLKSNIAAILLCKLALHDSKIEESSKYKGNSLYFENNYYSQATISNPQSTFYERKYINVEALEIWLYDNRTGVILKKLQLISGQ